MYQLVMSTVHTETRDEKYDADSCVYGIPDLGTALKAAIQYKRHLSLELGINFVDETDWVFEENSPIYYKSAATLFAPGRGPAQVVVEIQRQPVRDEAHHIVTMMQVLATFTHPDQYYAGS